MKKKRNPQEQSFFYTWGLGPRKGSNAVGGGSRSDNAQGPRGGIHEQSGFGDPFPKDHLFRYAQSILSAQWLGPSPHGDTQIICWCSERRKYPCSRGVFFFLKQSFKGNRKSDSLLECQACDQGRQEREFSGRLHTDRCSFRPPLPPAVRDCKHENHIFHGLKQTPPPPPPPPLPTN